MASGTATRSVEELRTALNTCYSAVEALCADLAEAQWQVQSLCPEWTVRGVVDHLTSVVHHWLLHTLSNLIEPSSEPVSVSINK